MSHRNSVVPWLMLSLAAVLASACGDEGDDDGGTGGTSAGSSGSAGSSAGQNGKGGSSGSSSQSGGSAGKGGSAGSGGTTGGAGSGGKGGTGGAGSGGKGGTGAIAGEGGTGALAGEGGSGGTTLGGRGGSGGVPDCEIVQCIRPIDCVEVCGGPVLKSSCCPCDEGTFDNIECDGSGGSASRRGFGGSPGEASGGAGFDLSDLNSECVDDACPEGLTPIHYYGIAGPGGPEFCSCSIPCEFRPEDCPDGTTCVSVSDGPGNVCWN